MPGPGSIGIGPMKYAVSLEMGGPTDLPAAAETPTSTEATRRPAIRETLAKIKDMA